MTGSPPALVQGEQKQAGVRVIAMRYNGTIHDFVFLNGLHNVPSTAAAIEKMSEGIREHIAR